MSVTEITDVRIWELSEAELREHLLFACQEISRLSYELSRLRAMDCASPVVTAWWIKREQEQADLVSELMGENEELKIELSRLRQLPIK